MIWLIRLLSVALAFAAAGLIAWLSKRLDFMEAATITALSLSAIALAECGGPAGMVRQPMLTIGLMVLIVAAIHALVSAQDDPVANREEEDRKLGILRSNSLI